jgi:HAD superfamily hydrolase (TIGR01549 family)
MSGIIGSLRFPYVLFDLGSTLIYFDGDWPTVMHSSLAEATRYLRSQGYKLDQKAFPEAYYNLIQTYYQKRSDKFVEYTAEHVMRDALRSHSYPEPQAEHLSQALKVMYGVSQTYWHREPDAVATLEKLRGMGCRMAIVSNAADDADVQTLVDNANLRGWFDFILTSAVAGVRKPNPAIFQQALAFWGAKPEQAVMIGDTVPADIAGANQMGIASVWIPRRNNTPENRAAAKQYPPNAIIDSLSELPELIAEWA